jgi:fibronectin type 3 domain-containing protein
MLLLATVGSAFLWVNAAVAAPPAPTNVTAEAGNKTVTVRWDAVPGATRYRVKRGASATGSFSTVATVSAPATQYIDTKVKNGRTYYYVVQALDNAKGASPNSAPSMAATPSLPAPAGLAATAGNRQIKLTWNAVASAVSYRIKRSLTPGGPYTVIGSSTTPSYTDTTAKNGTTYFYVVSAVDATSQSADSNEASATATLQAPTGLQATAGNRQVTLTWDAVEGADSYRVRRSTTSGGPPEDPYETVATVSSPTYTNTGLKNGTTYYYVVLAVEGSERSGNSNEASATPQLVAPANLTATAQNMQITLTWSEVTGADSYKVKRSDTPGGEYSTIATVAETTYIDKGLKNGKTYYYVVTAVEGDEQSPNSNEVSATPVLAPPTNLQAEPGNQQIKLTWEPVPGAELYRVKRSGTDDGTYTTIAEVATNSYLDTAVQNGKTYYYVVSAIDEGAQSANSNQVSATPALLAPTDLEAEPANQRVTLTWTASSGANSYKVRRSTSQGGPYTTIATTSTTTYVDNAVRNGRTYYYVVAAANITETSANSNEVSATPQASLSATGLTAPPAPINLVVMPSSKQIVLQWKGNAQAQSYNVKRSLSSGGPYETIAGTTAQNYTDDAAEPGQAYYYVVTAVGEAESEPSNEASGTAAE